MKILNARLSGYSSLQSIELDSNEIITHILPMSEVNRDWDHGDRSINIQGDWLSLGGVDLQINGALGLAFPEIREQDIPKLQEICDFLWTQGVDQFCPTLVTTSLDNFDRSLTIFKHFIQQQSSDQKTAQIIGIHLEGPFLNPEKRGAHPQQHLLPLNRKNVQTILNNHADIIKIITLAPELNLEGDIIKDLKEAGIIISLGHSLATAQQAQQAFEQGATMVTHAFNAMPSLHHREPGLLGMALTTPHIYTGFIADGEHICPTMLKVLIQCNSCGLFLVSDALSPLGLPDGIYPWDDRQIEVKGGTARLLDGTLSGTTLPLLDGVVNLIKWGICEVEQAINFATYIPRLAMGKQGISVGKKGHFLRWFTDSHNNNLCWERVNFENLDLV